MGATPQGPQVGRETAARLLTEALAPEWAEDNPDRPFGTLFVAPYGDEDATHYVIPYGAREWLVDGDEDFPVAMDQPAAFVSKTTGAVSFLSVIANLERLGAMTPYGDWPQPA